MRGQTAPLVPPVLATFVLTWSIMLSWMAVAAANHPGNRKLAQTSSSLYGTPQPVENPTTLRNGCVSQWARVNDYVVDECAKTYCPGRGPGPYTGCGKYDSSSAWCMLSAYRSNDNKFEGIAWKYTDDDNDPECLHNWTYYDKDGSVIEAKIASTTMAGSTSKWCGMATYVAEDDESKWQGRTWKYC